MMTDLSKYLTIDEIRGKRWSPLFCRWVERKLGLFKSKKKNSSEGRKLHEAIISRHVPFKDFYEEVFPTFRFLQNRRLLRAFSICELPCDSNLHFDLVLLTPLGKRRFEITEAREDNHHIRMEKFLSDGHVSALGEITYQGTKRNRKIQIGDGMVRHDNTVDKAIDLIDRAFARKTKRKTKNQDYSNTDYLIISVDDYVIDDEDYEKIRSSLVDRGFEQQEDFKVVIVIGLSGQMDLTFKSIKL